MSGEADPGARTRRAARRLPLCASGAALAWVLGVLDVCGLMELRFAKGSGKTFFGEGMQWSDA